MNNKRRAVLRNAIGELDSVIDRIQNALDSEQDCLDNMPENLIDSDRCVKMEENVDALEDAITQIESAKECILDAVK